MNKLITRTLALLFHALLNVFLISYITDFDVSGSWLGFTGFVLFLLLLLFLFVRHLLIFIQYIKTTTL